MTAAEVLQEITDRGWRRRHPAEVTASRIVHHMRQYDLNDRDRNDLNNAAHVLYRLAERARAKGES